VSINVGFEEPLKAMVSGEKLDT